MKGYGETLDPKAKFFVDYRLPAYTYDKLSCGLIDAHEYVHDPMAMEIHERLTRAIARLSAREGTFARRTASSRRTRTRHIRGMRPTPCQRICSSRISERKSPLP